MKVVVLLIKRVKLVKVKMVIIILLQKQHSIMIHHHHHHHQVSTCLRAYVWAASMNLANVQFCWASDEITKAAHLYWPLILDVAGRFNITRIKKCCQIMGRSEGSLTARY